MEPSSIRDLPPTRPSHMNDEPILIHQGTDINVKQNGSSFIPSGVIDRPP